MDGSNFGKSFLGQGFRFPVKSDPVTGKLETVSWEEDIKQAIYIILMTRKGERVMRPEFGCGIHDFAFASMDYTTISMMEKSIMEALILWEPRIRDTEVEIVMDGQESGKLLVNIRYVVRSTNNPYNLVYPFYINEGTELL